MSAGREQPAGSIKNQGFAAAPEAGRREQARESLVHRRAEGQHRNDLAVGGAHRRGHPGAADLPRAGGARTGKGPHEYRVPLERRRHMREEIRRHLATFPLQVARRENPAARPDHQGRRHADGRGLLQDCVDDARPIDFEAGGEPDDAGVQRGLGGQLLRLVAPLGDPLLKGSDLGIEQGLHAGGANLAQGFADAAIGPDTDAEQCRKQQQQGQARPVEVGVHSSRV
jgi:hypothetical protein